jgi:hypothetical protein
MKKNNLTTAVVAGLAGLAGISSISNAVNLNSDGVGQVLVYPYYTVNNGINTLISVVNTTDEVKAVKVRFLEGKNSRECLDFNLYMSPYDVWTAGLVATTATAAAVGAANDGQNNVKILTSDTSCTVPAISGQEFLPFAFSGAFDDAIGNDLDRCTEGHFEMIEMGTVIGADAAAATHTAAGVPSSCATINGNWTPATGQWSIDPTVNMVAPDGSGGLFGSTSLIDVNGGVDMTYNADAIQAYSLSLQHSDPGSLLPNVGSGSENTSNIFNNGVVVTDTWNETIQAVSALYMHDNIYGEYVLSDSIGANSEWVVTFPTKFAYVDIDNTPFIGVPYEPFTVAISPTGIGACEPYSVTGLYDREEQSPSTPPGLIVPSPVPPGVDPTIPVFCWETNVLEFNEVDETLGNSLVLGSKNTTHLKPGFATGWVSISFNGNPSFVAGPGNQNTDDNVGGRTYNGLPVTGFAVQRYTNSNLSGGVLANYAGIFAHRYSKNIL